MLIIITLVITTILGISISIYLLVSDINGKLDKISHRIAFVEKQNVSSHLRDNTLSNDILDIKKEIVKPIKTKTKTTL